MTSSNNRLILWGGFSAAVVALGLKYWVLPYGSFNLPGALVGPGLVVTGIASAVAVGLGAAKFLSGAIIFGSAAPTAVVIRVIIDCIPDTTRHNLWPFEVAIAYGVGLPWALGGAVIGWCLAWLRRSREA
jgi:hypothetical protein